VTSHREVLLWSFDGHGGARQVSESELKARPPSTESFAFGWIHLHREGDRAQAWLRYSGLDPFVIDALTAGETRPRCTVHGEGAVVNLRGVNLDPGAEPEDMISVRFWLEERRVIGVWLRPLIAVDDLIDSIERQRAPVSPGDLIAKVALRLADRAEPVIAELNERVDALEEGLMEASGEPSREEVADIRRTAIVLRRFMVPQRDALTTLEIEDLAWLRERDRSRLREAADRVTRLGEELDAIRDRAQIVHDQLMDRRSEDMNRSMLLLSVVAAIFLPLGLLTGLLGINVGGIPGTNWPYAFLAVCAALVVIVALQVYLIRRFRLLR